MHITDPERRRWMHEFRAHGAVKGGPPQQVAFDTQAGMRHWRQKSERVEIGLQVSPMRRGQYALTLAVGGIEYTG